MEAVAEVGGNGHEDCSEGVLRLNISRSDDHLRLGDVRWDSRVRRDNDHAKQGIV